MYRSIVGGLAVLVGLSLASPASAGIFGGRHKTPSTAQAAPALFAQFDIAMEEERLVDAGRILDTAIASGASGPELMLRSGELHLLRGRLAESLTSFQEAQGSPKTANEALQGQGLALLQLNRAEQARRKLTEAVSHDPSLWRAWNALGVEADRRQDWDAAQTSYERGLQASPRRAILYNNRGYSRLLQGRTEEAAADFVQALSISPGLSDARSNLRLALALKGDYERATSTNDQNQRAGILNNAGFAAMMRGDLDTAQKLFQQAIEARGSTYGRALENLNQVQAMKAGKPAGVAAQ